MKNNKFLKIYALIILIILLIIFIIPDSVYLKLDTKLNQPKITKKETPEKTFASIEKQQKKLINSNYEYKYLMMDSMGTKTLTYECTGTVKDSKENGSCISPKKVSYTEQDKKEAFSDINTDYINLEKIFNMTKDIEPKEFTYNKTRELTYNTKILDLETEIVFYTDLDNITQINISNAYMTYVFKYNPIKD